MTPNRGRGQPGPDRERTPISGYSATDNPSRGEATPTNALPGSTGQKTANDFLDRTLEVWQPHSSKELTREDARQIAANVSGFFKVLAEWATAEQGDTILTEQQADSASEVRSV